MDGILLLVRGFAIPILQFFFTSCNSVPVPTWVEKPFTQEVKVQVQPLSPSTSTEVYLRLHYHLDVEKNCEDGVVARIEYQGRMIRTNLFPELTEVSVSLGRSNKYPERLGIHYFALSNCEVKSLAAEIIPQTEQESSGSNELGRQLAQIHSPFLVIRPNQKRNPFTDTPLALAYSVIELPENSMRIRYTIYFTDEDSVGSIFGTDRQMSRYGRRTDIEWIYEVELDSKLQVTARRYQGGIFMGIGHRTYAFGGEFLPESEHPILYDIADHNVFSDSKSWIKDEEPLEGYHFTPENEVKSPEAREWVMFRNPWMFRASDRELEREKKISLKSTEYIYVLIEGNSLSGELDGRIALSRTNRSPASLAPLSDGTPPRIPSVTIAQLGEDLWGQQSFTAIPIGTANFNGVLSHFSHGVFELSKTSTESFQLKAVRFFRLTKKNQTYETNEITGRFQCGAFNEKRYQCTF